MAPKTVNWAAIKKRYLLGEKPKDLAADFGLTASQVSDKAKREKWKPKKARISQKIEQKVEAEIAELDLYYGGLILGFGKDLYEARKSGTIGLTVQDGEGLPNKLVEHVIKAGLTMHQEREKLKNAAAPTASTGKALPLVDAVSQSAINLQKLWGDHDHPTDTV